MAIGPIHPPPSQGADTFFGLDRRILAEGTSMTTPGREVIGHVVRALSRYLADARVDGLVVPAEVGVLRDLLLDCARARQGATGLLAAVIGGQGEAVETPLLTKTEAARALRCSVRTIDRLIAARELPAVKVESATRIRRIDLDGYVDSLGQAVSA